MSATRLEVSHEDIKHLRSLIDETIVPSLLDKVANNEAAIVSNIQDVEDYQIELAVQLIRMLAGNWGLNVLVI